jgi:hypothetical protein
MRIAVVYLKIVRRIEQFPISTPYEIGHKRFFDTYRKYRPVIPHDLLVVRCGSTEGATDFDSITKHYLRFDGWGSDCAAYQQIVRVLDYDLVLCCNTLAFFWRSRWLEPFAEAMEVHGKGVYGATASYENNPHLRTPAIAFSPDVLREYPFSTISRQDSVEFESGANSITLWAERAGYPTILVTSDGRYYKNDWRKPDNIFRRGDQSNCLIWDRHTEIYANASAHDRELLGRAADRR